MALHAGDGSNSESDDLKEEDLDALDEAVTSAL
jgi:hypothetical protein